MGLCVHLLPDGTLSPTGESEGDCTAFVLASPAEHEALQRIDQLFAEPDTAEAVGVVMLVFTSVLGVYLLGMAVGSIRRVFIGSRD